MVVSGQGRKKVKNQGELCVFWLTNSNFKTTHRQAKVCPQDIYNQGLALNCYQPFPQAIHLNLKNTQFNICNTTAKQESPSN